jgi:hypothetical protein
MVITSESILWNIILFKNNPYVDFFNINASEEKTFYFFT